MKKFASILLSMLMATGAIAAASAETYTGTAQGIGEVSVTLTVEDGKITAAEVVGESETKGIGYEPCADGTFADAIVAAQGVDFDSISGATVTSTPAPEPTETSTPIPELSETMAPTEEAAVTVAPSESAEQEASSENVESTDKGMSSAIWILVVVIIIGIAVVIWLLKKKGKNSES